jgi:hypothetical protein
LGLGARGWVYEEERIDTGIRTGRLATQGQEVAMSRLPEGGEVKIPASKLKAMSKLLKDAVKEWLTLPQQHRDYKLCLNDYLEKKGIKATEKEMEKMIEKVTDLQRR